MVLPASLALINDEFIAHGPIAPDELDRLLAAGWRHFGRHFFRYSLALYEAEVRVVVPLRIRMASFSLSKSQRRNAARNGDLECAVVPLAATREIEALFDLHKTRFAENAPGRLYDFVAPDRAGSPTETFMLTCRLGKRLVAASFFDEGAHAVSGIYAIFDPALAQRGLGIFTMLREMEFAAGRGKAFYYHGYAYSGRSFYDYKKQFRGTEAFDWKAGWRPL